MSQPASSCPMHDNIDRRKSAPLAIAKTEPDEGAHWIKDALLGRKILRNKTATQAGAGADMLKYKNPEQMPVFFLDGEEQIRDMTVEEARFFHNILNKKINRTTVEKHIRLARNAELRDKGFIFRVDRIKRKPKPDDPGTIDAVGWPPREDDQDLTSEKDRPQPQSEPLVSPKSPLS